MASAGRRVALNSFLPKSVGLVSSSQSRDDSEVAGLRVLGKCASVSQSSE